MHVLRSLSALALAGAALLLLPSAFAPDATAQEPAAGQEEESPLAQRMEVMDKGMKALRRSVGDAAKTADNLTLVRGMKAAALESLPLCPEPFTPMDATQKEVWRIGFERRMLAVADGLLLLEQALIEGRLEDAKKQYEAMGKLKKEGHDSYIPPEEE